jgi:hypothetical protein
MVTGAGRLQFYSTPSERFQIGDVFVIPKDELVAYAEADDGWSQVMYMNPRTGNTVSGWVQSARSKQTGGRRAEAVRQLPRGWQSYLADQRLRRNSTAIRESAIGGRLKRSKMRRYESS